MLRGFFSFGSPSRVTTGRDTWVVLLVPGLGLILFGLLILIVPELLVAMVALVFLLAGGVLTGAAWRLRKAARGPRVTIREVDEWE